MPWSAKVIKPRGYISYAQSRPNSAKRGYGYQHREWRDAVLDRDSVCAHCRSMPATQADHIVPFRRGGARFDVCNGQGLCISCHSKKTARERKSL
jgi:5-methylcytosine-specific restriction endonuclease McrA